MTATDYSCTDGAIVSLFFPGAASNMPYTADNVGVDKEGHTTWRVQLG